MSSYKPIQIVSFSKKNILLRLIESDNYSKWDRIFCRMGACRNNSTEDPGWIISKDKLDDIEDVIFHEERKNAKNKDKSNRSRNRSGDKKASAQKSGPIIRDEVQQGSESKEQESKVRDGKDEEYDERDDNQGPSNRSRSDEDGDGDDDREDGDDEDGDEDDSRYSSSEEYSTEEDESSDDELIQKVLARRLKYQSSQKVINETKIEDSDQEDVISHSRRFRYLYDTIKLLEERITVLEAINKNKE